MRTTSSICLLAALGSASAFIAPSMPAARSVTIMPKARALRMAGGHETDKAGNAAASAGDHLKQAGKEALSNSNSSGKGEASKAGDKAQDAAHHLKQAGKDAINSASSSASSSSSTGNATVKGSAVGVQADSKETVWEAPVEKTRIHEREEIVDKTRVEEQRIRTEVKQIVQPIKDSKTVQQDVRTIDHGTEVRTHGESGLDAKTEAELKRRRDELAVEGGTTREKQTKQTNLRPDVDKKEFVNVVEQVVPVIERDIYVPKKVEHEKKVVEIYNEAPVVKATEIKDAITKEEFEKRYGGKVEGAAATTSPTAHTTKVEHKQTSHTSSTGGNAVASSSTSKSGVTGATGSAATTARPGGVTGATTGATTGAAAARPSSVTSGVTSSAAAAKHDAKTAVKHDAKTEEAVPYSMSSSNMIRDAEADTSENAEGEGTGLIGSIKEKLKNILE